MKSSKVTKKQTHRLLVLVAVAMAAIYTLSLVMPVSANTLPTTTPGT